MQEAVDAAADPEAPVNQAALIRLALGLTDWEAIEASESAIVFRILFDEPDLITVTTEKPTKLTLTLNLQEFTSAENESTVPKGSNLEYDLPPQTDLDTAEMIENFGNILSWVFLGLMAGNGITNSMFESLDY